MDRNVVPSGWSVTVPTQGFEAVCERTVEVPPPEFVDGTPAVTIDTGMRETRTILATRRTTTPERSNARAISVAGSADSV
ncbi:MAG: hypothetical protein ACI80F_001683 [Natronomonas sp.]|jgi:hypothetical protein|uniref:hypothetical protein n=1 Tax=Natronomonas sp. TaxID=2184060 RepID=UPI003988AF81